MPLFISSDKVDKLAQEAMILSHAKSKREAVERALLFFIENEKNKIPFHEKIAKIQDNFRKLIGKEPHQMTWSEEQKKQFYDELNRDE